MDLDRVTSAMARLPESDRMALVLRSEQGLSYAEIARILEISEGSARVKVHRARRRLLETLRTPRENDHERQ
jgi:RNA polymerase sigma-70 factor (ECF subfamily)